MPFDIADSIKDPRGFGFWKHQFRVAQTGRGQAQVDRETLEGFFPFRLFDGFVTSIEDAAEIFSAKGRGLKDRARQQCLAVRLNVLQDDLGWYSRVGMDDGRFLWEFWNEAHTAFLAGEPEVAKTICENLNEL